MQWDSVRKLIERQSGVISRAQLHAAGFLPHELQRLVRRRDLARIHPGVFVNHTGPPTWHQRAWAAVLHAWPSALHDDSALMAAGATRRGGRDDDVIHVAVDISRRVRSTPRLRVHRITDLDGLAQWNLGPPRVKLEHAALALASRQTDNAAAIAVLADVVQDRLTTAGRLMGALDAHPRLRRRALLGGVLADIDDGACSLLEIGYLRHVERAHGLPTAQRQVRASARGVVHRDVEYAAYGLVVELDGRLFHDSASARHRDLTRDLDTATTGLRTVRIGWGQVFGDACDTARAVGKVLRRGGWQGRIRDCGVCGAPDAPQTPQIA